MHTKLHNFSYQKLQFGFYSTRTGTPTFVEFVSKVLHNKKIHVIRSGMPFFQTNTWKNFWWTNCHIYVKSDAITKSCGSRQWSERDMNNTEIDIHGAVVREYRVLLLNRSHALELAVLCGIYVMTSIYPYISWPSNVTPPANVTTLVSCLITKLIGSFVFL